MVRYEFLPFNLKQPQHISPKVRRIDVQCQVDTGHLQDPAALAVEALQHGDHLCMAQAMLAWSKACRDSHDSCSPVDAPKACNRYGLRRAAGSIIWIGCGIQWWKAQSSRSRLTFGAVLWDSFN